MAEQAIRLELADAATQEKRAQKLIRHAENRRKMSPGASEIYLCKPIDDIT